MLRASNEKNFRRIICPPRFIVIALIISDVRGGGRISRPLPPGPRRPKQESPMGILTGCSDPPPPRFHKC